MILGLGADLVAIARAALVGMGEAVREMRLLMQSGAGR